MPLLHERRAEAQTASKNAAETPEAHAFEATDNTEFHTAAANATDDTDVNEAEAFKKPSGYLRADSSENKSLKKTLQDGQLNDDKEDFIASAVTFQEQHEDEDSSEEDPSEEEPFYAAQLQQLQGKPKSPQQSQVQGMPQLP